MIRLPPEAAARECLEETGYRADVVHPMGAINPNPAFLDNRLYAFHAPNVEPIAEVRNSPTEQTEVMLVPKADIARLLARGKIDHALVAATLLHYLHDHA